MILQITFISCTVFTWFMLQKATKYKKSVSIFSFLWLLIVGATAQIGFFQNTDVIPPRFPLIVLPLVVLIISLFLTTKGKNFIDTLSMKTLVWMSIVRIPVELTLWGLFKEGMVPEVMTFEGRNWDILAGITAPVVAILYFNKRTIGRKVLLLWNILSMLLLINIIIHAVLSVTSPIQQFGFDQPNMAILTFPFVWLASFVAPAVLFSHFIMIRRLRRNINILK